MLSVIVRRSTFTIWSTIGIFQTRPGPRGGSSSRPKRNMTARSYSRRTRTKPSTTSILPLPPHRELEPVDCLDLDLFARHELRVVGRVRVPEGSVDEDEPGRAYLGTLADHRLHAGLDGQALRRESLSRRERPEDTYHEADADDQPGVDVIAGRLVLEQEREAEAERDQAAGREHAVRRRVEIDDEQGDAEQQEREPSPARSEHREP